MILIVDDRPENLIPLKKILEREGYMVHTATSGEEALKKIIKKTYTLIILDVQMPGMDGFEVAETLKLSSVSRDIPVIFLSAVKVEKKFISKGYESGGIDYVTKPIDEELFLLKVRNLYNLSVQNRQLIEVKDRLQKENTIRRDTEERLKETVEQLEYILESLPQIAFTVDSSGNIDFMNSQWAADENLKDMFSSVHPDDLEKAKSKWIKAQKTNTVSQFEVRLKNKPTEEYRWFLFRAIPVKKRNIDEITWVGTFTDIEEQKKIEKQKDDFLGIASHELKTPLTSLKAYFQLMERILKSTENIELQKYMEKMHEQIDRLKFLIGDLLDVSRIQSGRFTFDKTSFEFEPFLDNVLDNIKEMYPSVTLKKSGGAAIKLYADKSRIEQVLLNYLTNAIKYSPERKEIIVESLVKDSNELEVRVTDFGIGIPKEKQDHLFEKFYRVEESAIRFQGLGIGLYISAEIIKRHGGSFGVESELNEGSTFYFTLPLNGTHA